MKKAQTTLEDLKPLMKEIQNTCNQITNNTGLGGCFFQKTIKGNTITINIKSINC